MAGHGGYRSIYQVVAAREWGETFYAPPEALRDEQVLLGGDEAHHLVRVLRKRVGEQVGVMDGKGNYYICRIENTEGPVTLHVERHLPRRGETRSPVVLLQAILKEPAMDDVVDRATQMGVSSIVWVPTAHAVGNLTEAKLARHQRIARAAAKQCGRSVIPTVERVDSFQQVLKQFRNRRVMYVAHPLDSPSTFVSNETGSKEELVDGGVLLVGPEGGLSQEETTLAQRSRFAWLSLGNRRLRSPTAATVGLAILLRQLGEF